MDAIKLTTKLVRDEYFDLINLLNKTFPGSVDEWGKFTDCHSRNAWISFGYSFNKKQPSVCISFWCRELKEYGNNQVGQHSCKNLIEAYDYIQSIKSRLLDRQKKHKAVGDLFAD